MMKSTRAIFGVMLGIGLYRFRIIGEGLELSRPRGIF